MGTKQGTGVFVKLAVALPSFIVTWYISTANQGAGSLPSPSKRQDVRSASDHKAAKLKSKCRNSVGMLSECLGVQKMLADGFARSTEQNPSARGGRSLAASRFQTKTFVLEHA